MNPGLSPSHGAKEVGALTTGKHEGGGGGGEEQQQRDGVVVQRHPESSSQRDPLVEHVVKSIRRLGRS